METVDMNDYIYGNTFEVPIIKLDEFSYSCTEDNVIAEYPFTLVWNGKNINTFLCTPSKLEELVIGFLLSKGYIRKIEDIISLEIDKKNRISNVNVKDIDDINNMEGFILNELNNLKYNYIESDTSIHVDTIYEIMKVNLNYSKLFKETGGAHSVAIFENNKEIVACEDVARHNAMDKAIGHCILKSIPLDNKAIVVSGRISFDMLSKVARAKIPIVISKSAPTNLSIELAKKLNITLIGFARGKRMNIYTHSHRIKV